MPINTPKARQVTKHINPLPTWFRLDRDNLAHLERLIYDEEGKERKPIFADFATISKWIDQSLCGSEHKGTGLKSLCEERGSMTVWDYVRKMKLGNEGDPKIIVLYLLHEVKMEMVTHMIEYLLKKRNELELNDWFILVGYFFDRLKKLKNYSTSSLEMSMPDALFNLLLKEQVERDPIMRYANLFYEAMRWFAIHEESYKTEYTLKNDETLERFEVEGRKIFNKIHRIKSIQKKFFSQLRRKDKPLYRSIYGETIGAF